MSCYSSHLRQMSPIDAWLQDTQTHIPSDELEGKQTLNNFNYHETVNSSCASFSTTSSNSNTTFDSQGRKPSLRQSALKCSSNTSSMVSQRLPPQRATSPASPTKPSPCQNRPRADTASLKEYGECYRRLGEGSTAVVMVIRRLGTDGQCEKWYAIKQFRKRHKSETEKTYMKKLTSEFCISSTFSHPNVIHTIDLVLDEKKRYCTVMEYCSGGDLFSSIMAGRMTDQDKACAFKQMMQGIGYLHSMGVAHRDIKPENLLLTANGQLKITDFGASDVFRFAWEAKGRKTRGLVGSEPYIAPETFSETDFWGANADVWSAGIVLYCLWFGGLAWHLAKKSESAYASYVQAYPTQSFDLFRSIKPAGARALLYRMLDPNPDTRITAEGVLNDTWTQSIQVCTDGVDKTGARHWHTSQSAKR